MVNIDATLQQYNVGIGKVIQNTLHATQNITQISVVTNNYNNTLNNVSNTLNNVNNKISNFNNSIDSVNDNMDNANASTSSVTDGFKNIIGALGGIESIQKGMNIADSFMNANAKLNMVNDGLQTTGELQNKVFAAAERSRGSYSAISQAVAKLGTTAKNSFKSNDEMLAFAELAQKSFKIGGATKEEQDTGMNSVTQAMSAGKLDGDAFGSLMENAPMIADAIANFTGKSKDKLMEMANDGKITSDIIKGSMFSMKDKIDDNFSKMPRSFEDIFTSIKNNALFSFQKVIAKSSEIINSDGFQAFANIINGSLVLIAEGAMGLINIISYLVNLVSAHMDIIIPLLIGIGAGILTAIIIKLWGVVPALYAQTVALYEQAVAWLATYWPVLLVIGAVFLLIFLLNKFGVSTAQIIGFITGLFFGLMAGVYNGFSFIYNFLAGLIENIANKISGSVYDIKMSFYDMAINVLQVIRNLAGEIEKLINSIPGVEISLTGGLDKKISELKNDMEEFAGNKKEFIIPKMKYKNMGDEYNSGYSKGFNFTSKIGNSLDIGNKFGGLKIPPTGQSDTKDIMQNGAMPIMNGNGGGSSLDVSINKDDLKYLKDIAERDYIAKYSTAALAPNVSIQFGDVTETADANKVAKIIEKILKDEIAVVAEGVYA